jgi:outer membrane protease
MRIVTVFAGLVIIFFCAPVVRAQVNKDYAISLSPQFGFLYGHAEELVYPVKTKADLLSLLLWDMKPVFYYGFLMDFSPVKPLEKRGFFFGLSMKSGIPGPSGVMEDRDWQSIENTELTNFSSHDNITKELFLLDFSTGYSFPFFNALIVKTFINISYMNFLFDGENGYRTYAKDLGSGKYGPIANAPKVPMSGKLISYSQEWFYTTPGISLGYGYKDFLLAEISFMITPLVLCADHDEHYYNIDGGTEYRDNMKGGIMIEPGFRFSYTISKWLGISCDISWRYVSGTRGPTYSRSPIGTGFFKPAGEAGAGLSILNTALLLKVRL